VERPAGVAITLAVATGIVAALALLFVHQDPATWQTATSGGSTSDIVTAREAVRALALLVLVVVGGVRLRAQGDSATTSR
jgi:hypothetical protein